MYVVTDLTRFREGNPDVCTALIHVDTGACVRPIPYLRYEIVKKLKIVPGALITGEFTPALIRFRPHTEDCDSKNLKYHGPISKNAFKSVLEKTAVASAAQGFNVELSDGQKHLPANYTGDYSIITLRADPASVTIHRDSFDARKIKISFRDESGFQFRYLAITDLGFFDHAANDRSDKVPLALSNCVHEADELFLRVGLSRAYTSPDGRSGFWLQVNGIYTFPDKIEVTRGYSD